MQNTNRKVLDTITSRTKIYLALILILLIVICWQTPEMTIYAIIGNLLLIAYTY